MIQKLLFFVLIFPIIAWPHAGLHTPTSGSVSPVRTGEFGTPNSHGGYGYITSSEAEGREAFDFACDGESVNEYTRVACHNNDHFRVNPQDIRNIENLAEGPFRFHLQRSLRKQVFEYASLQTYAASGGNGGQVVPEDAACFDSGDRNSWPATTMNRLTRDGDNPRLLNLLHGDVPTDAQLRAFRPGVSRSSLRRVANAFDLSSNSSLVTGIITAGYFNRAYYCLCVHEGASESSCGEIRTARGLTGTRIFGDSSTECRSLSHTLFRVKQTYPGLFQTVHGTSTEFTPEAAESLGLMAQLLGGSNTEVGIKRLTQDTGTNPRGPSGIIRDIMARLNNSEGSALRQSLDEIRTDQMYQGRGTASTICTTPLNELISENPQSVRQMLIDARERSVEERDALRAALCRYPEFRTLKSRHCLTKYDVQTRTDPTDGENYQVVRGNNMSDYPFSGDVNYRFRTYRDGSHTRAKIKLRLNMVVQPGSTLTAAQLQTWQTQAQTFFNNEASRLHRRVDFEFNFTQGPAVTDGINVNFHQCWCSTCSASLPAPNSVPPARNACVPGRMSQADSGNFPATVDMATIQHEIGHGLGLPDEYSADYYNFNTIGEPDSLMNTNGRLYSRHFNRMLHPNECY